MDLEGKLRSAHAARSKAEAEGAAHRYREASRARLLKILKRKHTTAFIGALAAFEAAFGRLWGHGTDPRALTADEAAWRAVWEECRNQVLNNGNAQARAVETELAQYTVVWDRYTMTLPAADGPPGVLSDTPRPDPEEGSR
jgi:hypothetical protein